MGKKEVKMKRKQLESALVFFRKTKKTSLAVIVVSVVVYISSLFGERVVEHKLMILDQTKFGEMVIE